MWDLDRFVAMNGIFDLGEEREAFQYVNGWSMSAYERLVESLNDRVRVLCFNKLRNYDHLVTIYRCLENPLGA